MSLNAEDLMRLESMLGQDFISYCAACTANELSSRIKDRIELSAHAEDALEILASLTEQILAQSIAKKAPADFFWEIFGIQSPEDDLPLANKIRRIAGGELESQRADNTLANLFQRICINVYPLFLIPVPEDSSVPGGRSFTRSLLSYPESRLLAQEILNDPDLSRLSYSMPTPEEGDENVKNRLFIMAASHTIEHGRFKIINGGPVSG